MPARRHTRLPALPWLLIGLVLLTAAARPTFGRTRHVGPEGDVPCPCGIPWDALTAGDEVVIAWRAEPYRCKWAIPGAGVEDAPILVRGTPGPEGARPLISGIDAETPSEQDTWGGERSILKIGGVNSEIPLPPRPGRIIIEGLAFAGARPPYQFTGRDGVTPYRADAAAIHVETGDHITIRNCSVTDSANGVVVSHDTSGIVIEACTIAGNGLEGSIFTHNIYTEATDILIRSNRFGMLRENCPGNNIKDRSGSTQVLFNRIEGGNRLLDLVESDYPEIADTPTAGTALVAGNLLIKRNDAPNNQVVHFGGDGGTPGRYRRGRLTVAHNTVILARPGKCTLLRLSTREYAGSRVLGNVFHAPGERVRMEWVSGPGEGKTVFAGNRFSPHPVGRFAFLRPRLPRGVTGADDPGFRDLGADDFRLAGVAPIPAADPNDIPGHILLWCNPPGEGGVPEAFPIPTPLLPGAFQEPGEGPHPTP